MAKFELYDGKRLVEGPFESDVRPDDTDACTALLRQHAFDRGIPIGRALLVTRVRGRKREYRTT